MSGSAVWNLDQLVRNPNVSFRKTGAAECGSEKSSVAEVGDPAARAVGHDDARRG